MKLTNKTSWNTDDLKALFNKVLQHKAAKTAIKYLEVQTSKVPKWCAPTNFNSVVNGVAYSWGGRITMRLPKHLMVAIARSDGHPYGMKEQPLEILEGEQIETIAQVFAHEVDHILGVWKHKNMIAWDKIDVGYTKGMTIRKIQPKPKKQRDLIIERYAKAITQTTAYAAKIKRYKNLLKKWDNRRKRYEKCYGERLAKNKSPDTKTVS